MNSPVSTLQPLDLSGLLEQPLNQSNQLIHSAALKNQLPQQQIQSVVSTPTNEYPQSNQFAPFNDILPPQQQSQPSLQQSAPSINQSASSLTHSDAVKLNNILDNANVEMVMSSEPITSGSGTPLESDKSVDAVPVVRKISRFHVSQVKEERDGIQKAITQNINQDGSTNNESLNQPKILPDSMVQMFAPSTDIPPDNQETKVTAKNGADE